MKYKILGYFVMCIPLQVAVGLFAYSCPKLFVEACLITLIAAIFLIAGAWIATRDDQ